MILGKFGVQSEQPPLRSAAFDYIGRILTVLKMDEIVALQDKEWVLAPNETKSAGESWLNAWRMQVTKAFTVLLALLFCDSSQSY